MIHLLTVFLAVGVAWGANSSTFGIVEINVLDSPYNTPNNGKDDATPALQRVMAAISHTGGVVYFPPGEYRVYSKVNVVGNGIMLRGAGGQATKVLANSTAFGVMNASSIEICDMALMGLGAESGQSAVIVTNAAFIAEFHNLWISNVWRALECQDNSNQVTLRDVLVEDVFGPSAFLTQSSPGQRLDIVQFERVTTNQINPAANATLIWLDMQSFTNTVRLDNVGFLHGGTAIRMGGHPSSDSAYPFFLFANVLEVDFPNNDAIQLLQGRSFSCSNCYIQGSQSGVGIKVGEDWVSEVQVVNSRISGHFSSCVSLSGGVNTLFSNNIIAGCGRGVPGTLGAVDVDENVSGFSINSNKIGWFSDSLDPSPTPTSAYGVWVHGGTSCNFTIVGNMVWGNKVAGIRNDASASADFAVGLNAGG